MEQYEAMMDSQLPPNSQNAMSNYQVPISFPQFSVDNDSMNSSYGNLSALAGSYPHNLTSPGANMTMGAYNSQASQQSPYSGASSSFSMPYDPPPMQGASPLPMPTPSQQPSSKPIYSCTYCGLVLSSNNALIEHKRIHTGERPYACHICNKRFTQKAHLNIHKRIHTGEKPYACHICHKRFAQSSHLSSHKRIHTGEKPFVCGICHIGFTQKQRLDAHLKKHMERPGEDISPGTRRSSMMTNQAQMMERMESYRQSLPREDPANMLHMVGQGMPYIKQETVMADIRSANNPLQPGMNFKGMMKGQESADEVRQIAGRDVHKRHDPEDKDRNEMEGDMNEKSENKIELKNQNVNAPSFSSEGMFLHPSGYVAYGGIEDNEDGQQSPRTGPTNPSLSSSEHSLSPTSSGHRRKSSFVRKRQSESPDKNLTNSAETGENADAVNGLHRFHALNPEGEHPAAQSTAGGGEEEEEGEEEVEGDEYKDTGELLDDKNDPPYQGSMHPSAGNTAYDQTAVRKSPQAENIAPVSTRSNSRRTSSGHDDMVNGDRMGMNAGPTLSYAGPPANPGLVKVNNRISLVNFTADELISHLIKRDDVHCCQFCCLVFQDAAMYHIHRNMHDKQDIRRCNMCGKLLMDKYDFTAHFLSMHQN